MPTLHDGTVVDSYSEEWRHECEARSILNMPRLYQRRRHLYGWIDHHTRREHKGILQIRGEAEVKRLEKTMMALWQKRQAERLAATANDNQAQTDAA